VKEHTAAQALSVEIDRALEGKPARRLTKEVETTRHLLRIRDQMPPVPPELEQRIRSMMRAPELCRPTPWQRARPTLWGALVATVLLLLIWTFTPSGRVAWADMLNTLRLGQARVELTPTIAPEMRVVRQPVRDLVAAELLTGRAPAVPKALPEGYVLQEIAAVSYPDLPPWISQPFFIELSYGLDGRPPTLWLRQYRLLFREYGGISGFEVASDKVGRFEEVEVAGVPGTLLEISGDPVTLDLLWERDGRLLELSTVSLGQAVLMDVAQTVR